MSGSLDLDEVDRAILRSLRENARISLQEISRRPASPMPPFSSGCED